jgi:hypothetical protein
MAENFDRMQYRPQDRLILYLRIVHSVDYYSHSEYPNEDEMPNRCGIMHARASIPVIEDEIRISKKYFPVVICIVT